MAWVIEWSYPCDNEHNISLWDSKDAAYMQAASEIQECIESSWDMSFDSQCDTAKEINDYIIAGNYKAAVDMWNSCDENCEDEYSQFWYVSELDAGNIFDATLPKILPPSHFPSSHEDEEYELDHDSSNIDSNNSIFVASNPGATCRKCSDYNAYAYADNKDGTYLCRSCAIFKSIFT